MLTNSIFSKQKTALTPGIVIRRLLTGWLTAALVLFCLLPQELKTLSGLAGLEAMSFLWLLALTGAVFALLTLAGRFLPERLERWLLTLVFFLQLTAALTVSCSIEFLWGGVVILCVLIFYSVLGWDASEIPVVKKRKKDRWSAFAAAGFAVVFFLLICVWTLNRYWAYMNASYDFGIFAQAFHSLRTTLVPYTTIERDGMLSHFAVHVSPIFYLLLPFYCLAPRPETLQVIQAALMASAAIPIWKLAKCLGFSGMGRVVFCLMLFLSPAYAGGAGYDFHENACLTPLLLWLFYGIHRKNLPLTALFALLTLMVKEDAAVYVAVIGLWLLLQALVRQTDRRWNGIAGAALLTGALVWFLAATAYLAGSGDGVMTFRYSNFLYGGSESLLTVVKAVLLCPMKALFECMDESKVTYLFLTLLPFAGLPLLTRRYERLVLLIPYILINLLSDYAYQHDILFQYSFGSLAFLLYLSMVNLQDLLRTGNRKAVELLPLLALMIGSTFFGEHILPEITHYKEVYEDFQETYDSRTEMLATIPSDASVAATTHYTPHLSQREILYDIRYCTEEQLLSCEYVALKPSSTSCFRNYATDTESGYVRLTALLAQKGYVLLDQIPGSVEIYQKQ